MPVVSRSKHAARAAIRFASIALSRALPLRLRMALVASNRWKSSKAAFDFSLGILDDLRQRDPVALHRFLWSNHLAYAASYEVAQRFGASNLNSSRRILFDDMASHLSIRGLHPGRNIRSILELGCSMGYLLRHLEVNVCPAAEILHGFDIDAYAIQTGMAHLASLQSKVKLSVADMAAARHFAGGRNYDLILCCGALMYVNERTAQEVVRFMLSHATRLVGIICLASPDDSSVVPMPSEARQSDGAFVHDVDRMIRSGGGKVVLSRWIGSEISGSNPSYAILAEPPRRRASGAVFRQ